MGLPPIAARGCALHLAARRRRPSGFTLLEVLVALSIFALIGVASYRVLSSVMETNARVEAHAKRMRAVNRAFWLMQLDIEQLMRRNVRTAGGAIPAGDNYLLVRNGADLPLEFTRGGRANPLGLPRSSMLRVAYAVGHRPGYDNPDSPHYREKGTYLLRYTWPMLDGSGNKKQARVQVLLPGIKAMTVGVLTADGTQTSWPVAGFQDPPQALQIVFTLADGGHLKRLYKIW